MAKKKGKLQPSDEEIKKENIVIGSDENCESYDSFDDCIDIADITTAEREEEEFESGYKQWSVSDNGKYIPCFKTVFKVPPGIYELKMSQQLGFHIQKQLHFSDDLLELPMKETKEIMEDIKLFWNREEMFKRYGYTHKRGILLYGPPGNGKSYLIQVLSRHLIKKMKGIVINLKDHDSVQLFLEFAGPIIRTIEPSTPIIVIMEDIDNIMEYSNSVLTKVLNMLDGLKQINKVVYVATTNYPERLQERVSSRPSRFDRRYKISSPNAKVREFYIRNVLSEEDLNSINVKQWVQETKDLSIAHIKELIISVILLNKPFELALEEMKNMTKRIFQSHSSKGIGFSSTDDTTDDSD